MKRLGILGWPAAHSRSPEMHAAAFAALDMTGWRYQRLPVPPELFDETVRGLGAAGFVGANVTVPHKHAALALADHASEQARQIGAANTLVFAADGAIEAHNTDAPGLVSALEHSLSESSSTPPGLADLSVLVLGAGGSARAAVWGLHEAGVREILVWNRTPARAQELVSALAGRVVQRPQNADVLINCTTVGLQQAPVSALSDQSERLVRSSSEVQALNQLGLGHDQLGDYPYVVDLVYRTGGTPLLRAARRAGARTVDGIEILVYQGALSFELWTGVRPPLDAMRAAASGARTPDTT
jgi:shikimate dehydrogenase